MFRRLQLHLLWLCLAGAVRADVLINFRNNVLNWDAKVRDRDGRPLVNDIKTYVAQLYWGLPGTSRDTLQRVGNAANFRTVLPDDALAGTWLGANRTIPGLAPDTEVWLQVRVWDSSYASYEVAAAAGGCSSTAGESEIFPYRNALSVPSVTTDTHLAYFRGFSLSKPSRPLTPCYYFSARQSVTANEDGEALVPPGSIPPGPVTQEEWVALVTASVANLPTSYYPFTGSISIRPDAIFYRPRPHTYGNETLFQIDCCDKCSGCMGAPLCWFTVQPSPKRPYLATADSPGTSKLVLRGLAPRRYRVEQSVNLSAWNPVGEFTANHSEVPVLDLATGTAQARFFRAIELPQ